MKTKATPEKEILKKTSTSKVIQTLARKPQGPTSLPKPVTRGTTAKRGTVPKEKTPDLADMSMNEDSPEADLITDDSAPAESLQPTDSPLVSQLSFAPAADTPEWVLTFQREFRAHEQRIASLEYAMAEIVRLKTELDATKTELGAANARVASLQKQILTRTDSGSNASKYASLPPTKQAATAVPPSAAPASEFPPLPSKPQSTSSTQKTVNTATTTKRKKKPLKTLLHIFEPPRMTDPSTLEGPQYMYVHVPNKYRTKLSKYRSTLRDVGFDTGRILDIHYPAKGVAALLIHTEYSTEVHELLEKSKLPLLPILINLLLRTLMIPPLPISVLLSVLSKLVSSKKCVLLVVSNMLALICEVLLLAISLTKALSLMLKPRSFSVVDPSLLL